MLEVPVDLSALLRTTTTECVREIDTTKLTILLQWIVDCLHRQDAEHRETKHSLKALCEEHQEKTRDIHVRLSDALNSQEKLAALFKEREKTESEMREKLTAVEADVADITVRVAKVDKQFCEDADVRHIDLSKRIGEVEMRLQLAENGTAHLEEQNAHGTRVDIAVDPSTDRIPTQEHRLDEQEVKTESGDDHGRMDTGQTSLTRLEERIDNIQNALSGLKKEVDALSPGASKETTPITESALERKQLDLETHSIEKPQDRLRSSAETHRDKEQNVEENLDRDLKEDISIEDRVLQDDAEKQEMNGASRTIAMDFPANDRTGTGLANPVMMPRVTERRNATEAECAVPRTDSVDPAIQTSGTGLDSTVCEPSPDTVLEKLVEKKTVENADGKLSSFSVEDLDESPRVRDVARDNLMPSKESRHEHTKKAQTTTSDPASVASVVDSSDLSWIQEALKNLQATKENLAELRDTFKRLDSHANALWKECGKSPTSSAFSVQTLAEEGYQEAAEDPKSIQHMQSQLQGFQKTLFDLVQRVDSADPQAIQTVQKRLRKLETGFKRISEQWKRPMTEELMESTRATGTYAMLSGKPVFGYRCMACDRPLETLQMVEGPHLPSNALPKSRSMSYSESAERLESEPFSKQPSMISHAADASIGPRLRKGGWKTQGNYHRKLRSRCGERKTAA